ncbi:MAG: acyltransferase [Hyphomonas sp.]
MPEQARAGRFVVLDGLRGLAAFAVIVDHVDSPILRALIPGRYLAVDFFFVLSGFVLANAYQARFDSGMSALGFMRARFIRLYPMYLLGLAIVAALTAVQFLSGVDPMPGTYLLVAFGTAIFMLPTPPIYGAPGASLYPLNAPAWTLLFELLANALYALTARWLTRGVLAFALPVLAVAAFLIIPQTHELGAGWLWPDFGAGLIRVLYGFFAGVFIFKLRDRLQPPPVPAWFAALGLLILLMLPVPEELRRWFDSIALVVLVPLLVFFAQNAVIKGRWASLATTAGLVSYGVYVLHVPIYNVVEWLLSGLGEHRLAGIVVVGMVAVLATLVALLADKHFDMPFRSLLRRRLPGR